MRDEKVRVAYFPEFRSDQFAEFTDQYYRFTWYLKPVIDRLESVSLVRSADLTPSTPPTYLDPVVSALTEDFSGITRLEPEDQASRVFAEADYLLHWDNSVPIPPELRHKRIEDIDRHRHLEECQVWLNLSSKIGGNYSFRVAESAARYKALVERHRTKRAYVFGTGPNLSLAKDHDYRQGVVIACNSMVKNTVMLDQMRPPLLVAGDPIFHAGASAYAADFRTALYEAMERYNADFLTNQRDFRIYHATAPAHLRERIIGAPADWGVSMNANTTEKFTFTACPNVLTLFLLPIGVAMSTEELFVAGCDGRSLTDNKYFWAHDKSVQFNDKMSVIQEAHPSFFDLSYDEYYYLHCETVAAWIGEAETVGRRVVNMTPSFIPALSKRYEPPADVRGGEPIDEAIPLATRIKMRQVFLNRQWTALRHTLRARFLS